MSQDSDHADKLREMEEDDDSEATKVTELNPSNADVLQAIKEMDKRVTSKIDGVMSAIKEVKERVKEAEERISGAEDEIVLRAARSKGMISYKEHTLRFLPDVSAEVHRKQRAYDGVRQRLRERGIGKHRIIYSARLLVTHQEKSRVFDTPVAVEIEELDKE
ncbi:LINE-1 retrotransposable element ORF1 protein [Anabarilius grahami]|uniref:LINE-1 retrotransposable element ORF1 protein n=1 Tax=Anabarilius grahami TaxID=495550 RepID=A0A3N0Z1Y4_ANAGA|nr:LINE-1 retrotransposable element ORF1 protein [Anabarilius grahami]